MDGSHYYMSGYHPFTCDQTLHRGIKPKVRKLYRSSLNRPTAVDSVCLLFNTSLPLLSGTSIKCTTQIVKEILGTKIPAPNWDKFYKQSNLHDPALLSRMNFIPVHFSAELVTNHIGINEEISRTCLKKLEVLGNLRLNRCARVRRK